jgi:hypothetical protein
MLLVEALKSPVHAAQFGLADWDVLIRQARRAALLPRLCVLLEEHGVLADIDPRVRMHLESARTYADKQHNVLRWEVRCIQRALADTGVPLVLLKGAAYVMGGFRCARGRVFTDIDILVARQQLKTVEDALFVGGWMTTHLNAYDQRYYRRWMHELPPLRHIRRGSVIDVHHNILPDTARLHPDPVKMLDDVVAVENANIYTLSEVDMVLHSATHLFHDGELENGLRDLHDLDGLLRHFGKRPAFWEALIGRAAQQQLLRPLYYALRYTRELLDTPVPADIRQRVLAGRPVLPVAWLMDRLFRHALLPAHRSCDTPFTPVARWLLYIRSHYLRMPLHLLIPHLLRKATRNEQPELIKAGGQ